MSGCDFSIGDWQCREGGYLWDAGTSEGYDPTDCTYICPHCRTKDFLEAAKEEAEGCCSYSNNWDSGTGLDIWKRAEAEAMKANRLEAIKALKEIGLVSTLVADNSPEGYTVVICNNHAEAV